MVQGLGLRVFEASGLERLRVCGFWDLGALDLGGACMKSLRGYSESLR